MFSGESSETFKTEAFPNIPWKMHKVIFYQWTKNFFLGVCFVEAGNSRPGVILNQNCIQFLDAALNDLFFQNFVSSKAV